MRGAGVGLADDDDPAVVSRIIVAAAADIGRNDVAGGGQPLGNKGMLVRTQRSRREMTDESRIFASIDRRDGHLAFGHHLIGTATANLR